AWLLTLKFDCHHIAHLVRYLLLRLTWLYSDQEHTSHEYTRGTQHGLRQVVIRTDHSSRACVTSVAVGGHLRTDLPDVVLPVPRSEKNVMNDFETGIRMNLIHGATTMTLE